MKFKKGDIIQRINNNYRGIKIGDLVVVKDVHNYNPSWIYLEGHICMFSGDNFELNEIEQIQQQMRNEIENEEIKP